MLSSTWFWDFSSNSLCKLSPGIFYLFKNKFRRKTKIIFFETVLFEVNLKISIFLYFNFKRFEIFSKKRWHIIFWQQISSFPFTFHLQTSSEFNIQLPPIITLITKVPKHCFIKITKQKQNSKIFNFKANKMQFVSEGGFFAYLRFFDLECLKRIFILNKMWMLSRVS